MVTSVESNLVDDKTDIVESSLVERSCAMFFSVTTLSIISYLAGLRKNSSTFSGKPLRMYIENVLKYSKISSKASVLYLL